mmetsp:Transcript_34351/g.85619  ORF Transcript_34351/g.85619 Transcript_34351/m.85619 type:complete len:284 (-) Transcript_34351:358-1209(-)
MFFITYTSASRGIADASKKSPAARSTRARTSSGAASRTGAERPSTCSWSNRIPFRVGCFAKIAASSVPVPPPTSTTVFALPFRLQSKSSAAPPASSAYVLTACMLASNRAAASGLFLKYSKKELFISPAPLPPPPCALAAAKLWLFLKLGVPVLTACRSPLLHARPSSSPEKMVHGRMEPTASVRNMAPSGVSAYLREPDSGSRGVSDTLPNGFPKAPKLKFGRGGGTGRGKGSMLENGITGSNTSITAPTTGPCPPSARMSLASASTSAPTSAAISATVSGP